MEEDSKIIPKVSGYLEKKGKMKMMSSYKRYWFVLEGRLLLYYRSKDEYEAISPCKGSINLGPPCNVKPCSSLAGVFQIETRTSTITLRAENREDQTRWMQGIMSALNQNKNSNRLSHFRYSLDELTQQQVVKGVLERQNTIPQRISSPASDTNNEIIQRLQKMGAQSYSGNMSIINHVANNKKGENTNNSNLKENDVQDLTMYRGTILIDNEQYGVIKRNSVTENIDLSTIKPAEHIYERISRDSTISTNNVEFNYSVPHKTTESGEKALLQKTPVPTANCKDEDINNSNILRKVMEDKKNVMENLDRPTTFLLENETYYGVAKPDAIQNDKDNADKGNKTINEHYCRIDKRIRFSNTDLKLIYTEPETTAFVDHNENNLVLSSGQEGKRGEDNAYSITKLYDSDILKMNNTVEYEDLDNYSEYTEPVYSPKEDIYTECTNKSKSKLKKEKKKKHSKDNTDNDKKDVKLKKTSSFIKRVWKKRGKHKEKEIDIEELYESVPATVVEKVSITDGTAVQMLSELQNILENKKPILKDRLSTESAKQIQPNNDDVYMDTPHVKDGTVELISELQNILENKKTYLMNRKSTDKYSSIHSTISEKVIESANENKILDINVEKASSSSESEEICPLLPPKNQKVDVCSPYHDFPNNNQPINKVLPLKKKLNFENVKSLDEILQDLDKEKCENANKNKVKKLIKRFSEPEFNETDVVLRPNKRSDYSREEIDSDELSRLLDELAEVTSAPILTPGATSSLIGPIITDEELIKLLPVRHRRYSEPDYDIPRPHKSLTNLPRKENPSENVIGSTRFFGPILKPSDINIKNTLEDTSHLLSMTPDSLEPDIHVTKYMHHSPEERNSYTSHTYVQLKNCSASSIRSNEGHISKKNVSNFENSVKNVDNIIIENDIYAQPKSLHNLNSMKGFKMKNTGDQLYFKSNKNIDAELDDDELQDVFIDSLEV